MEEIFKDVPNYEGLYQVSNLGNVKSLNYKRTKKEKLLKPEIMNRGYFRVQLKGKRFFVHQLVAMAFLGHKPSGYDFVINHINFNRLDNRLENLEIVTQRENINHRQKNHSSKYTGVSWRKGQNKWVSRIKIKDKIIHLGYFDCEIEANKYYQNALEKLNTPEEIKVKLRPKTSKYKGVCWNKRRKKWLVKVMINYKEINIGYYDCEEEAKKNYEKHIHKLLK